MLRMVHTGLLGRLILVLFAKNTTESEEYAYTKCYHPLYDGENLGSLIRVHTNLNPSCFNHSQLTTCQEDGKVYWLAKNTASFGQHLLGECPMGEVWFCFEHEANKERLKDLVKEIYQLTGATKKNYSEVPIENNLFSDLVKRISKELSITNCRVCGNTKMWPWEGISWGPLEILKWKQTEQKCQILGKRAKG